MASNEQYEGDASDRAAIGDALRAHRVSLPLKLAYHVPLAREKNSANSAIDWSLFDRVVKQAQQYFSATIPDFKLIPEDRYRVAHPESGDKGGFFGAPVGGYYYLNDLGFTTYLDAASVPNKTVRTLELARNYLHDSLHAATFKTYRIDPETGMTWRHQYGINFRDTEGNGYSSPKLNDQSPDAVNLNTWMDATTHIEIAKFFKQNFAEEVATQTLSEFEKNVVSEMMDGVFDAAQYPQAIPFYNGVMNPARDFIAQWGKQELQPMTFQAMMSGNLEPLKAHFVAKTGMPNAWEQMFRQAAYRDTAPAKSAAQSGRWAQKIDQAPHDTRSTDGELGV